ncbi:MAG: sugar ABC transporter permease [Thermomicrobiales bacterium]
MQAAPTSEQPKGRYRQWDGKDKWVVVLMAGIPALVHVGLIWVPTLMSIGLSFTNWNGIRFSDMSWVGLKNYDQIFNVFYRDFYQALINNFVLLIFLFIFPTALGMLLAYILDRDLRGTRIYQSLLYAPVVLSLAVVGFMWQSVIYSPENGLATQIFGRRRCNRLARQSVVLRRTRQVRHFSQFYRHFGRHRLAAHRLHHGPLPGRIEERRQLASGSGATRRQ